jgi:hypothetical protein
MIFGMNYEQIKSLIVKVLALGGGFFIGKYGITTGAWEAIVAAVVALFTVYSSFKSNTDTSLVKAAEGVAAVDSIKVSDSAIAEATGPKVTSS